MQDGHPGLSSRLQTLTSQLREIDLELRGQKAIPDKQLLQEFRQAMDDIRLTAWTVNEVMNAQESRTNPQKLLTFLAAERVRRLSYMIRDLCSDMDRQSFSWQHAGVQNLSDAVLHLQSRITKLIASHRAGLQRAARRSE
jgi:hypothetical protein